MNQKIEFEMTLFDNEKNRSKTAWGGAFEIMFDDIDNIVPESWRDYFNAEAGDDVPWGAKYKITIESIEPD
jgi:hypothetical protein